MLVARSPSGQAAAWPVVETVQTDGICTEVLAPAPGLDPGARVRSPPRPALRIAGELGVTGVLAVEMFEVPARRTASPGTSSTSWPCARTTAATGRWTAPSRASSSSTCGPCSTCRSATRARGRRGRSWPTSSAGTHDELYRAYRHVMARDPGAKVHIYGKAVRPGRKIGHVNVIGADLADARERAAHAADYLQGSDHRMSAMTATDRARRPVVGIVMGSDSDWPVMREAAAALAGVRRFPTRRTSSRRTGCPRR